MTPAMHSLESPIDRWMVLADKKLRGICQQHSCEELADVSDARTSLAYCMFHFWRRDDEMAWEWWDNGGYRQGLDS